MPRLNTPQGTKGFNKKATRVMRGAGISYGDGLKTGCTKSQHPFAHVMSAAWLAGPDGAGNPDNRLLVIHRTGSGKTSVMLHALELWYDDPRPKIAVFPNGAVVRNFYKKLLETPSRYQAYVKRNMPPSHAADPVKHMEEATDLLGMKGRLSRRGQPGFLAAPLRSVRYNIAGGGEVFGKGGPNMPVFKIGYQSGGNPFDNKIILMDEVHNLIAPPADADARRLKSLARMRAALFSAKGSVIIGLTATPFVYSTDDGVALMRMIKGAAGMGRSNEGYVSYFNSLPTSVYPRVLPSSNSVRRVAVRLKGPKREENLGAYVRKAKDAQPTLAKLMDAEKRLAADPVKKKVVSDRIGERLMRLANYCNMSTYYASGSGGDYKRRMAKDAPLYATKLAAIADLALSRAATSKVVILIRYSTGLMALVNLLRSRGATDLFVANRPRNPAENRKNMLTVEDFNGKQRRRGLMVLDAATYGEGIDVIAQHFIMANPAPNYALYKQWRGRVLRACGYTHFPPKDRAVTMYMFVATNPAPGAGPTADEILLERLEKETAIMDAAMQSQFGRFAIDSKALGLA